MSFTIEQLLLVALVTWVGATVQGTTGIGFSLLAGPGLIAVDPAFAPGPMVVAGTAISARHVLRERDHLDRGAARRILTGAPLGIAGSLALVTAIDVVALRVVIGVMVIAACVVLLAGFRPPRTPGSEFLGGAATAFSSLTAALPGPPLAITLHDAPPAPARATIGVVSGSINVAVIVSLVAIGRFGAAEMARAAILLPIVGAGLATAAALRPRVDGPRFVPVVLVLAATGGASLVATNL